MNYKRVMLYTPLMYVRQQEAVVKYLRGNQLHLSGGGPCDSPGYLPCAHNQTANSSMYATHVLTILYLPNCGSQSSILSKTP